MEHFWFCVLVYRQKPVFHDESTLTQTKKKKKKMDPSEDQKCLSINKVTFHTSNFSFIFVLPSSYCIFKAVERSLSSHCQLICQKIPNKYNGFSSSTRLIRNRLSRWPHNEKEKWNEQYKNSHNSLATVILTPCQISRSYINADMFENSQSLR